LGQTSQGQLTALDLICVIQQASGVCRAVQDVVVNVVDLRSQTLRAVDGLRFR
jgi:hypothetical protein